MSSSANGRVLVLGLPAVSLFLPLVSRGNLWGIGFLQGCCQLFILVLYFLRRVLCRELVLLYGEILKRGRGMLLQWRL